jgi:uncharacterized delta-60 repeat protein
MKKILLFIGLSCVVHAIGTVDGDIDPTFNGGAVQTITKQSPISYGPYGLAVQSDGKIVLPNDGISGDTTHSYLNLLRLNSDGSADTSYDITAVASYGDTTNDGILIDTNKSVGKNQIFVTDDDSIIVVHKDSLIKYFSDGTRDTSFNANFPNTTMTDTGSDLRNGQIVFDSDGKIFHVIYDYVNGTFVVDKYNADGSDEAAFNGGAILRINSGTTNNHIMPAITVDNEKNLIIASRVDDGTNVVKIWKYSAIGELINTFFITAVDLSNFNVVTNSYDVFHIDTDMVGNVFIPIDDGTDSKIIKILADFSGFGFDFGGTGVVSLSATILNKVLVQDDGKILAVGSDGSNLQVHKLNYDGSFDQSFGDTGISTIVSSGSVENFILDHNDNIVVGLNVSGSFQAVRVLNSVIDPLVNGLVAHYEFNYNGNDSSGNEYNLTSYENTNNNGVLYGAGMFGYSAILDGDDAFETTPYNELDDSTGLTLSAWIKPTISVESGIWTIIRSDVTDFNLRFNGGVLEFSLSQTVDGTANRVLTIPVSDTNFFNQWNHITATFFNNGETSELALYINGVEVNSTFDGFSGNVVIDTASGVQSVGAWTNNGSEGFIGHLDDVRVYDRAFTNGEVGMLYNYIPQAIDSNCSNPVNIGHIGTGIDCNEKLIVDRVLLERLITIGSDVTQVYTGQITDMSALFQNNSTFDQDISSWNVSNVTDFSLMFSGATFFNQDISSWDVSSATTFQGMFMLATNFNQNISSWNTSNVIDMSNMFQNAYSFNQPLADWDISKVENISRMFENSVTFNQPLNDWNTSSVTNMNSVFKDSMQFNQPLDNWDTSKVSISMFNMFYGASSFNQDLSSWDVTSNPIHTDFFMATLNEDILEYYPNWGFSGPRKIVLQAHGGVLQFDGNSYVQLENINEINSKDSVTIEAWVNLSKDNDMRQNIFRMVDEDGDDIVLRFDTTGATQEIEFEVQGDGGILSNVGYVINQDDYIGVWHHIVGVYDGSSIKIYVDGELKATNGGSSSTFNFSGSNFESTIGAANSILQEPFNGMIDEVRIWDTALTQNDINKTKNMQLLGNETGLIAYYNFDERIGDIVKDITNHEYDATIEANATRVNFLGENLVFNGESSKVEVSSYSALDLTEFTINAWINPFVNIESNQVIISRTNANSPSTNPEKANYLVYLDSNENINFAVGDGTNSHIISAPISFGQWSHISVQYSHSDNNQNGDMKIFINGKLASYEYNTSVSSPIIGGDLFIGSSSNDGIFLGNISEVSIFDRVLSDYERNMVQHSALDITDSSLVGYWPLNEGIGTNVSNLISGSAGVITDGNWMNNAPFIYGDKIYSTLGIASHQKAFLENYDSSASFDTNASLLNIVDSSTGRFIHYQGEVDSITPMNIRANFDDGTFMENTITSIVEKPIIRLYGTVTLPEASSGNIFTFAIDDETNILDDKEINYAEFMTNGTNEINYSLNTDLIGSYYLYGYIDANGNKDLSDVGDSSGYVNNGELVNLISSMRLDFNLTHQEVSVSYNQLVLQTNNVDLGERNITKIELIDMDDDTSVISVENGFVDGNNSYELQLAKSNGTYLVQITLDDTSQWFYNFEMNKLYFTYNNNADQFIYTVDTNLGTPLSLNLESSNFTGYTVPSTSKRVIPFIESSITQNEYDNSLGLNWDISSMYVVSYDSIENEAYTNISKIILDSENNSTYDIDLKIQNDSIDKYEAMKKYNVVGQNNILTIDEDNISNAQDVKYIEQISATELNNYYSNYINSSFPDDAMGYKLHQKQNKTVCRIHGEESNSNITTIDDIILANTIFNSGSFLEVNYLDNNKILLFSQTQNQLVEYDVSTGTQSVAGTWSIESNTICEDQESNQSLTFDMIVLDIVANGYHQENIAFDGTKVYRVEYNKADTYNEYILLGEVAAKHIYLNELYNSEYLSLDVELTDMWTYLSFPSNITVCSEEYTEYLYDSICNSGITLNSIFGSIGESGLISQTKVSIATVSNNNLSLVEMVLKFSNNTWSYWEPLESNATYNMNKFNTLNQKEGFLVKITDPTTIKFPLNIFKVEKPLKVNRYNQEGWYLAGSQFKQKVEDVSIENGQLMYVVAPDSSNTNWNVFTPKTDIKLDPSIEVIRELKTMQGYWIYNK